MEKDKVKEHFAAQASDYEELMIRLIPHYIFQNNIIAELLPEDKEKEYKVLDLGCGNGILSQVVLKELPYSYVTGFDITEEMIKVYRDKISAATERYDTIQGDYKTDNIGQNYDIIIAGLTLHHLKIDERAVFYKKLFDSMSYGGCLICRDIIIDEDEKVMQEQYENWKAHMKKMGEDQEFWFQKHIEKDYTVTLPRHLKLLKDGGFSKAGCYWRYNNFAVTKAVK